MEEAREAYEECVSYDRLRPDASAEEVEEAKLPLRSWMAYAVLLKEMGKLEEAIYAAGRGMRFGNFSSWGNCLIGSCYAKLRSPHRAVEAFQASVEARPEAPTYVLLYFQLYLLDRDQEAEECLYKALELEPDYDEAHYNLACCAIRAEDWELAEFHLRWALEVDPDYAVAHAQLGWALMQRARRGEGSELLEEAEGHLRLSVALDGEYFWGRTYLAQICWMRESLDESETHWEKLTLLWPKSSATHTWYGNFLGSTGRNLKKAERHLRKAVTLDPEDGEAHFNLGKLLYRQDRDQEAYSHLWRAHLLDEERAARYLESYD